MQKESPHLPRDAHSKVLSLYAVYAYILFWDLGSQSVLIHAYCKLMGSWLASFSHASSAIYN